MTITAYVPASTWHGTVPTFDDAEPPAASIVSTPLQVLADNTKFLARNVCVKADWLPNFDEAKSTTYGSAVTNAAYTDVNAAIVQLTTAIENDRLLVTFTGYASSTAADGYIRLILRYGAATKEMDQGVGIVLNGVGFGAFTIVASILLDNAAYFSPGAPYIAMQAKSSSGTVTVMSPVSMQYQLLRTP